MKKLVLILALMIIPCSAFGLEMLNDSTMDGITGQAGVNIAVDDIQMFINIEKLAWIDCDGFASYEGKGSCSGGAGAIVLNNFQIDVLNINAIVGTGDNLARGAYDDNEAAFTEWSTTALSHQGTGSGLSLASTSCGSIPLFYQYATSTGIGCQLATTAGSFGYTQTLGLDNYFGASDNSNTAGDPARNKRFVPHFLSIDVTDSLPASTQGFLYWRNNTWTSAAVVGMGATDRSSVGGVLIGLPSVEIYINQMLFTPMYDGDIASQTASIAANDDDELTSTGVKSTYGTIQMTGITFTVLSGWMEISPK